MTVGKLIQELANFPTEAEVIIGADDKFKLEGTLTGVWDGLRSKYSMVSILVEDTKINNQINVED